MANRSRDCRHLWRVADDGSRQCPKCGRHDAGHGGARQNAGRTATVPGLVSVRVGLQPRHLATLDALVEAGDYSGRSECLRSLLSAAAGD